MLPCSNCGRLAEDGARFCPMCGERITAVPAPPPPMPEPVPDRRLTGALIIVIVLVVLAVGVGIALVTVLKSSDPPASDAPGTAPIPQGTSAATGSTRLTVSVFNCAGCTITARPADGQPSRTAPVINGTAMFTLAQSSTVGMSFQISHPSGFGSANGSNLAVLSVDGVAPGMRVGASTVIKSRTASVCWAGTLATQSGIDLVVEPFNDGTRAGDLRAWADPALATLPQNAAKKANGTVEAAARDKCTTGSTAAAAAP